MAKFCSVCTNKIEFLTIYKNSTDGGIICEHCIEKYFNIVDDGSKSLQDIKNVSVSEIKRIIDGELPDESKLLIFKTTKNIGDCLYIDEQNRLWAVSDPNDKIKNPRLYVYRFEDILSYEVSENKEVITKSKNTFGRTLMGGLLFGGIGAIVGGATSKKVSKEKIKNYTICITLKSSYNPVIITMSSEHTKQNIVAFIENIIKNVQCQSQEHQILSGADELIKYKQLLDDGVITQEEFDKKKKQILEI